ncbi:MAG: sulfatase/phosphatase domain-containing protein [Pseudomonadota bacterium]
MIVFTSDHGEMLGDHHLFGKGGPFDTSYQIPLIVRDPASPQAHGTVVDAFTESIDIFPTLIDRTHGVVPNHLDGTSLAPFLEGQPLATWREAAHFEFDFREVATGAAQSRLGLALDACNMAARREDRFKYVHFAGLPPLLFDLVEDPGETRDLSQDPDYRDLRLEMAEKLLSWRAEHLDRALTAMELTPDGLVEACRP